MSTPAFVYQGKQPRYGKNVVTIGLPEGFDRAAPDQVKALLEFAKASARESDCFGNHMNIYTNGIAEVNFYID